MKFRFWLFAMLMLMLSPAHAVEYTLPDLNGKMQSLNQYRGKWLIVNYWASWCQSCLKELPELNALYEKYKSQGVEVIGINFEQLDAEVLQQFVQQSNIGFPVLRSSPVKETPLGPVPALPTTYIVNPEGVAVAGQVGALSRQNIEEYLSRKGVSLNTQ